MERETGNQEAEVKNGVGALELYRPESQMLVSASDAVYKSHPKSGAVNCQTFDLGPGEGGGWAQ